MKMIMITLSLLVMVFMSGCADKRLILVPQSEYYPTFPTNDFNASKKYQLELWEETEEVNSSTVNYLIAEKTDMLNFIKDTKTLRSNYNLLLKKLNEFNIEIKEMNKIQNSKKPQEVQEIKDAQFN